MKRLLVALAALTAAVPPPAAHAGSTSDHLGECGFSSFYAGATGDTYQSVVHGTFVLYAPESGADPVSATVRCEVRVNGVPAAAVEAHGTTVVPVLGVRSFSAGDDDWIQLCTVVDYDDDTPTSDECAVPEPLTIPPRIVSDVVDRALVLVVDPVACQGLRLLPDVPGVVEFDEEGDVYVYGEPYWDCPPYDIWPPD